MLETPDIPIYRPRTDDEARAIRKSAYRWNTVAGLLFTAQSVIMLIVITRVADVNMAGVFTIAFAIGSLFMNMGMYGMRKFQVSDLSEEFTFREYLASRTVTTTAMVLFGAAYTAIASGTLGYDAQKTAIIVVMVLFKAVDAVEDVYCGAYQQLDRLDVGARMLTLRQGATLGLFCVLMAATGDMLLALGASTAFAFAFLAWQVRSIRYRYGMPNASAMPEMARVGKLLRQCFPLFAAAFLLFYIGSAPKYAIDAMMDDTVQAYYGYISMPVFAVSVLATFVYNPLVTELTEMWRNGQVAPFLMRFARVSLIIVGITAVCDLLALVAGVPVLNILYNADVSAYLVELIVLVSGGGFLAVATLATVGITIIRFQRVLIPLYLALAVAAYFISNFAVATAGIAGASWAYFAIMACTAAVFAIAFVAGTHLLRQPAAQA